MKVVLRSCRQDLAAPQDFSPGTDDNFFHGNCGTGHFHSFFDDHGKRRATWDFHDNMGDAFNTRNFANLCELFNIMLSIIKFRAAHHDSLAFEKISVKVGVGNRDAIRYNQQVRIFEKWRGGRYQHDLRGGRRQQGRAPHVENGQAPARRCGSARGTRGGRAGSDQRPVQPPSRCGSARCCPGGELSTR